VTVKQVAERLEVSASTVYGLVAARKIGHYRVGLGRGAIRIGETHIVAFLSGAEPGRRQESATTTVPRLKHIKV
jgi:excisionase family DNA binding protein